MKIIAANLKSYHTPSSTQKYFHTLESKLASTKAIQHEIIVFPNMACLSSNSFCYFQIGAQNIYPAINGAFTGEVGLEVIDSLGINYILLGHSERRKILGESLSNIKDKFRFCVKNNKKILLCIGEDSICMSDSELYFCFENQLQGIDLNYSMLYIAYEPVWAIGSKQTATLEYINKVKHMLRNMGVKICIYGGSVALTNAKEICEIMDGVLIGSASLEANNFASIIEEII
ncbi:triosephosphate isomerase [Helicobacter muridarum]|uniref:Triosephosphate isomerase n=1 Tax=Helicobacter muridarum TaxID=216 RepID=A0A099TX55_9HELI|nr:triose-phosphate isomerase family protein [Helicobacter muridarum]TLD98398.1 triosephosphate isomerase [Helicobacter muridarum]STQ85809.1 triosephosphate isomerase [Helicobacter muridarum]